MSTDRVTLQVSPRAAEQLGSRNVRRLRADGLVPGVLYGKTAGSQAFVVAERDLRAALGGASGVHTVVDVVVDGASHSAVVKDIQRHPVRGTLTHIDFHEVRLDQPIQATVQIVLVGESVGARQGGIVQPVAREVRVEALPTSIPEAIEVDITALELGGTIRLTDAIAIDGVTVLDDPETAVATCMAPRGVSEDEESVEGAEGEPASGEASGDAGDADSSEE
jgi:large subunit ribosomal protein L25